MKLAKLCLAIIVCTVLGLQVALAVVYCAHPFCPPNMTCPDGTECCCYTSPGYNKAGACCRPIQVCEGGIERGSAYARCLGGS